MQLFLQLIKYRVTYTIKYALKDITVFGFQVEHEDLVESVLLKRHIFSSIRADANTLNELMKKLVPVSKRWMKEVYIPNNLYERETQIENFLQKMFCPNNDYTKFDFKNDRPQKSTTWTTSSITINYSMQKNTENAAGFQEEVRQVIREYNEYYRTVWSLEDIERYNGDVNDRWARKKVKFKQFGKHIDLVNGVTGMRIKINKATESIICILNYAHIFNYLNLRIVSKE